MDETANLNLPYIMPSQAQKHVTHNEALVLLDAVVQLSVASRSATTPPEDAIDGARYIVPNDGEDDWTGWDHSVALYLDGGWRQIEPSSGWLAFVADENRFVVWGGEAWAELDQTISFLQNLENLGIGTIADAENPFAAKLNKALWTARLTDEGGDGDLRYTLNKEEAGNVLSLLMQSGWDGAAELGLIGDNDLTCKVSVDGETWKEAFRVNQESGRIAFPNTPAVNALAGLTGAAGSFARYSDDESAAMQAIVGPVSETGGVPTGAIVERGSTENGTYIRFADGTQICHHRPTPTIAIDTAFAGGFRSAAQTWTFPRAFAASSVAEIHVQASAGLVSHSVQAIATDETAAAWYHMQPASVAATERPASLMAIGRWF